MKVIADTGPLIGLAKIGKLYLLEKYVDEVLIPPIVYKELLGKIGPESEEIEKALNNFIKISNQPQIAKELHGILSNLDEGEKQAIALAKSYDENILLLIDERAGREVANRLQIPITGLLGILIKFKEKREIQSISTIVEKLRQHGYWLSDEVIELAKKLAGE